MNALSTSSIVISRLLIDLLEDITYSVKFVLSLVELFLLDEGPTICKEKVELSCNLFPVIYRVFVNPKCYTPLHFDFLFSFFFIY